MNFLIKLLANMVFHNVVFEKVHISQIRSEIKRQFENSDFIVATNNFNLKNIHRTSIKKVFTNYGKILISGFNIFYLHIDKIKSAKITHDANRLHFVILAHNKLVSVSFKVMV